MDLNEKIEGLAGQCLTNDSHFLVAVKTNVRTKPMHITVIVDGDNGISIDECATINRKLALILDEQKVVEENFTLEVTTPGVDQPLQLKRQYFRNTGRRIKVQLKNKEFLKGALKEVFEDRIIISSEGKEGKKIVVSPLEIPFDDIEKTIVQVAFK